MHKVDFLPLLKDLVVFPICPISRLDLKSNNFIRYIIVLIPLDQFSWKKWYPFLNMNIHVFFNLQEVFLNIRLKYVIQMFSFHAILLICILYSHYNSVAEFNIWECLCCMRFCPSCFTYAIIWTYIYVTYL